MMKTQGQGSQLVSFIHTKNDKKGVKLNEKTPISVKGRRLCTELQASLFYC